MSKPRPEVSCLQGVAMLGILRDQSLEALRISLYSAENCTRERDSLVPRPPGNILAFLDLQPSSLLIADHDMRTSHGRAGWWGVLLKNVESKFGLHHSRDAARSSGGD